jgi:hypothetical protein
MLVNISFNKGANMTCRGYDSRSVKVPKRVKVLASNEPNPIRRNAIIRSYVRVLESDLRANKKKSKN